VYPFRPRRRAAALLAAGLALACARDPDPPAEGLVFARTGAGSTELWQARLADGAERPITHTPGRDERWPYWSSESGRLLFQASPRGGRNDLYLWDPGSALETPLLTTPDRDERWQRWSPDGTRVAYAFRGGRPETGVAWVDASDGSVEVLAAGARGDLYLRPAFAPDGARVVAQRRRAGEPGSELWLLGPGEAPRPLVTDAAWFSFKAGFNRDGSRIVFSRRPTGAAAPAHEIASVDAAGGDLRVLAGGAGEDAHSAEPSPRRDEIAFVARRDADFDLYLRSADGSVRALTRTPVRDELAPRWSPDGERLVVTTSPTGAGGPRLADEESLARTGIAVLDRGGRELFAAPGLMPDWMPPWR